jgi:hypothetical protein
MKRMSELQKTQSVSTYNIEYVEVYTIDKVSGVVIGNTI